MTLREFIGLSMESYLPLIVTDGNGNTVTADAHKWFFEMERKLAWAADMKVDNLRVFYDRVSVNVI